MLIFIFNKEKAVSGTEPSAEIVFSQINKILFVINWETFFSIIFLFVLILWLVSVYGDTGFLCMVAIHCFPCYSALSENID